MITVKSTIDQRGIDRLLSRLSDAAPALDEIGRGLQASTKERISTTKVSPNGAAFAPWSFKTLQAREKDGSAPKGILFKSGRLLDSIQYQVVNNQVQVGSDETAPYAQFLQFGTAKMPARPFIGFSTQDIEMIRSVLQKHLRK